jgi:hypothetical protein
LRMFGRCLRESDAWNREAGHDRERRGGFDETHVFLLQIPSGLSSSTRARRPNYGEVSFFRRLAEM